MIKISPCSPLPVLALLLGVALPAGAAPAGPVRLPGGVADPAGRMGYVTGTSGGIDAVDLKTGRASWTSREASRPLLASKDRLAALAPIARKANRARVVLFDTSNRGKVVLRSDDLVFPEWVRVVPEDGYGFSVAANLDGTLLKLRWQARSWYAGGAPPPPDVEKKARRAASGLARIDLESGKARMLPGGAGPASVRLPAALKKVVSRSYFDGTDWSTKPIVVDGKVIALAVEKAPGEEKLVLRQWSVASGKATDSHELARGKELLPQLTLDGQHLLVQDEAAETAPRGKFFQLTTGKEVGRLNQAASLQGVSVVGPQAYFVAAPSGAPPQPGVVPTRYLQAVELKSGKALWRHPLGGPRPLPPRP